MADAHSESAGLLATWMHGEKEVTWGGLYGSSNNSRKVPTGLDAELRWLIQQPEAVPDFPEAGEQQPGANKLRSRSSFARGR